MAKRLLIITAWLFLGSVAAFSQSGSRAAAGEFTEADANALEDTYHRYDSAYVVADLAAMKEIFKGSFLNPVPGAKRWEIIETTAQLRVEGLKELQKRGYGHSEILQTKVIPLTGDRALLFKTYRRWRKDGSSMNEESAIVYIGCKDSGVWTLCGMLPLQGKYFGKEYRPVSRPSPQEEARRRKSHR